MFDSNGWKADDAYLIGLWVGFAALWFVAIGLIFRTIRSELIATAMWWGLFALWNSLVRGEGEGIPLLMGQFGLIAAVVTTACLSIFATRPDRAPVRSQPIGPNHSHPSNRRNASSA